MRFVGIDPSTKCGFVALGESGEVLVKGDIKGVGEDPKRMVTLVENIMSMLQEGDVIWFDQCDL